MRAHERKNQLLQRLISASGRLTVIELAEIFAVSERTLRYDLRALEQAGIQLDIQPGKSGGVNYISGETAPAIRTTQTEYFDGFIGYETELLALQKQLGTATTMSGSTAVVSGDAGMGKSRLCRELAVHARSAGIPVFIARGRSVAAAPPLWPWVQVANGIVPRSDGVVLPENIGDLLANLSGSVPELRGGQSVLQAGQSESTITSSHLLVDEMVRLLVALATNTPSLIIIDDLQWADAMTVDVFRLLQDSVHQSTSLFVGTIRTPLESTQSQLSDILNTRSAGLTTTPVSLAGLDEHGSRLLLQGFVPGGLDPDIFEELLRVSSGNPLFLRELGMQEGNRGRKARIQRIPEAIDQLIADRLSDLSAEALKLLQTASVLGEDFHVDDLRAVVQFSEDHFSGLLEEASSKHVLTDLTGQGVVTSFVHPLIHRGVYEAMPETERRLIHSRAAGYFSGDPDIDPEEVMRHYVAARGMAVPDLTAQYAVRAGERTLLSFAWQDSIQLFETAIDSASPDDSEWVARAYRGIAISCIGLDRLDEGVHWQRKAFDAFVANGQNRNAVEVATRRIISGGIPEMMLKLAEDALALADPHSSDAALLKSRIGHTQLFVPNGYDYTVSAQYFKDAIDIARTDVDHEGEGWSLGRWAQVDFADLDPETSVSRGLITLDIARTHKISELECHALHRIGEAYLELGDLTRAIDFGRACMRTATHLGSAFRVRAAAGLLTSANICAGNWDALDLEGAAAPDDRQNALHVATSCIGAIETAEGSIHTTLRTLRTKHPFTVRSSHQVASFVTRLVSLAVLTNDASTLRFDRPIDPNEPLPQDPPKSISDRLVAQGLSAMIEGDVEKAIRVYSVLADRSVVRPAPMLRALGLIAAAAKKFEFARAHMSEAAISAERSGFVPTHLWSLQHLGEMALEEGDRTEARRWMSDAEQLRQLAVGARMRFLEGRITATRQQIAAKWPGLSDDPYGLTDREVDVLTLLATGLTNRQIADKLVVTQNTVGSHIKSIYSKTECSNRAEATMFAAQRGLTDEDA